MDEYLLQLLGGLVCCLLLGWLGYLGFKRNVKRKSKRAAAEEVARTEAQRLENEKAAGQRADREAADRAAARADAVRLANAEAARAEAARLEVIEKERAAAANFAAEEAARAKAARIAADGVAREKAARLAAQQAAFSEAARVAAEEAARAQAARLAAQEAALAEAARQAAEATARAHARQLAEEEVARVESARVAAEAKASRLEAEHKAMALASAPPVQSVPAKSPDRTTVMVADDSKVVRVKTGRLLTQHLYRVSYATDGLDAANQMQASMPDVVITDVEMPGMDGFELTRHLRQNPLTAHIPVIMITAANERHREDANRAGVSVLLGKPYADDELIAHIQSAMNPGKARAGARV